MIFFLKLIRTIHIFYKIKEYLKRKQYMYIYYVYNK